MAGFFGFGGKTKYVDEPNQQQDQSNGEKGAFFLEPDDAKSFGNIEFMRKAYQIRRSFPKTKNGKGAEVISQVSSMEKAKVNGNGVAPQAMPTSEATQTTPENSVRRSADNSMDMFRQMAKDLKK